MNREQLEEIRARAARVGTFGASSGVVLIHRLSCADVPALLNEIDRRPAIEMEELKQLFDLVTNSMDFGSGFLDREDTVLLRKVAAVIGVDPMEATPSTEVSNYPHEFKPADHNAARCQWCNQERGNYLHPAAGSAEGSAEGGTSKGSSKEGP